MADLTPNELVSDVAAGLSKKGVDKLKTSADAAEQALVAAHGDPSAAAKELETLATELAKQPDLPELVTFAGFLGGSLKPTGKPECRLLYVDWALSTWLLVPKDEIVFRRAMKDDDSPSGKRDVIWVKADAVIGRGSGSQSVEGRFLTGDFTRAGDFEAPPIGGTVRAATGVFCEARTPSCCGPKSR